MDLCFQVVVKEVLLITMQTVKTYFQLIRIRSKDSFTIHFDETFFSVNNDNKNNSDNDINNNNKLFVNWLYRGSAWGI